VRRSAISARSAFVRCRSSRVYLVPTYILYLCSAGHPPRSRRHKADGCQSHFARLRVSVGDRRRPCRHTDRRLRWVTRRRRRRETLTRTVSSHSILVQPRRKRASSKQYFDYFLSSSLKHCMCGPYDKLIIIMYVRLSQEYCIKISQRTSLFDFVPAQP